MTEKSENERPGLTPIAPFRFIFRKQVKPGFTTYMAMKRARGLIYACVDILGTIGSSLPLPKGLEVGWEW